jgi:Na+-transporting methylmalonyl-CoA/oxaloacetate decarboxylase gamma subunit
MHFLIGLHAGFGELGALAFLWVVIELINPTDGRVRRATKVACFGVILLFLSWITGGYYYLTNYQVAVKALIKAGPYPWAHSVITEVKEHVFMFLPFLAIVVWGILKQYGTALVEDKKNLARSVLILAAFIFLLSFLIAGMGYLISSGARSALEQKIL